MKRCLTLSSIVCVGTDKIFYDTINILAKGGSIVVVVLLFGTAAKIPIPMIVLNEYKIFDSTGLPLLEHDKQTLKSDLSIITFLLTSVCFPHNSQKEAIV